MADLFNQRTIDRQCQNIILTEKQKSSAKKWLSLLAVGAHKEETPSYRHFEDLVLRDILDFTESEISKSQDQQNMEYYFENSDGKKVLVFELKDSETKYLTSLQYGPDPNHRSPIEQIWDYIGKQAIDNGVCSNYEEFILITKEYGYNKRYSFHFESIRDNPDKLKEFIHIFSYDHLVNDKFVKQTYVYSILEKQEITVEFHKFYHKIRLMLIEKIHKGDADNTIVMEMAHTFLNRLIFLIFAEGKEFVSKDVFYGQDSDTLISKPTEYSKKVNDESKYKLSELITRKYPQDHKASKLAQMVQQLLAEYARNKIIIHKNLEHRLTEEFYAVKSIKQVVKNNPKISEAIIRKNTRVISRLPKKLLELHEKGLNSKPALSSHIAFFATDHYNWDGGKKDESKVVNLALSLAKQIVLLSRPSHEISDKKSWQKNNVSKDNLSSPIAIWISVATLHIEYGMDVNFSIKQITENIIQQNLCNSTPHTIFTNLSSHCVANSPTIHASYHRKIYRVSLGQYRLYKRGEYCHPTRENCKTAPLAIELPDRYKYLINWYDEEYCK